MKKIILLLVFSIGLFAQDLNLEQALELIKHQNLEIKAAEYEIQSARLSLDMADAQDYGQLNFIQNVMRTDDAGNAFGFKLASREASFGDFGFNEFLAQMGGLPGNSAQLLATQPHILNYPKDQNYFQSKLSYELPLYTGNKLTSYQEMAKEMKNISRLQKHEQINAKIYETRKSFFDMALLEESLKNLTIILNNINRLEVMTKEMITEGYAKKVDLLEVQSKQANVARVITELTAKQELLYHYLSFLLDQEVSKIETPRFEPMQPQVSTDEILANNIDIQKAMSALKIRESMVIAEKSRYLPNVGAMAEYQTSDNTFLGDADKHTSYTLGLQLTWNLFNGGGDYAAVEKARIEKLKMQTQTQLAQKGIMLNIKEIQTNIKTANSKIKNLKVELALAKEIYENYENRYKEQLVSMSDVIIQQSGWLEKVMQLLEAKNSRNRQIFALERLNMIQGESK